MVVLKVKKSAHKSSIQWKSILIVVILAILFCLPGCKVDSKNGATTPDRVIEQYILALETRNDLLITRLGSENTVITPRIKARIDRLGGYKIQDRQISYIKSKPSLWKAQIRGFFVDRFGKRQVFDDSIEIEYQSKGQVKLYGGRWYLLF